jgi:hypothetical protein
LRRVYEEFNPSGRDAALMALSGPAADKEDLLTTVLHEMGHLAGRSDVDSTGHALDLMADTLPLGTRRVAALDAVFVGV